ncbi:MAG TPA: MFS transporter [Solirubrobacteraceae bacterium]|nr:MFS transporter [Solirubrobacteraceae bacterium]
MSYRRNAFTWTAFGALFAFGYLNAVLGPALPYIRSVEGISYLVGGLHQVAFAFGGGLAGALSARDRVPLGRRTMIAAGLTGGALAGLAVGYGETAPITIAGAFLMGLLATLALIRVWALAATAATWRLAFAIGTVTAVLAAVGVLRADVPSPRVSGEPTRRGQAQPTLVIIFAIVALEFACSFWLASYLNDEVGLVRGTAVAMVSALYASNLLGRLTASRLARTQTPERLLAIALGTVLTGLPFLLAATSATVAVPGIVLAGAGIGALFPLTSSLHVEASGRTADIALGETLTVAALGQTSGPLFAGLIAQVTTLRTGLFVLPALTLLAAAGLAAYGRHESSTAVSVMHKARQSR